MKKRVTPNEFFFLTFGGEMVSVTTTGSSPELIPQQEDEAIVVQTPTSHEGYLLDTDDEYYYLGDTSSEVSRAVKIEQVVSVEILKSKSLYDKILDDLDTDDKDVQ